MTNPPYGISDSLGWTGRKEAGADPDLIGVCIVQGQDLKNALSEGGYPDGYLDEGALLVPASDVSGDACYVIADPSKFSDGTDTQDEIKAVILFEKVYNLDQGNVIASAITMGKFLESRLKFVGYKTTPLTSDQKARFQRLNLIPVGTPGQSL